MALGEETNTKEYRGEQIKVNNDQRKSPMKKDGCC